MLSKMVPDQNQLAALRQHIETRLSTATIEVSPFPHLVVEKFFPDSVYEQILDYNPFVHNAGSEWFSRRTSANTSSRTPYFARKQINFHKDDGFEAPSREHEFWDRLKDCFLADHWFVQLVLSKYRAYFEIRFGDVLRDPDFFSLLRKELFLQRHDEGYYIGPHTDIPSRIFTCIFSFASRDGFEEYGTELIKPNDRLVRCWGNDHYSPEDFSVVKIAPYKPNNFLLFFKTRHSFHSVRAITPEVPNARYGMQFQLYEPPGGLFKDLSRPDLIATKMKPLPGDKLKGFGKKLLRR